MTLFAGKFTPAAKVGVAHNAFNDLDLKASSIILLCLLVNPA